MAQRDLVLPAYVGSEMRAAFNALGDMLTELYAGPTKMEVVSDTSTARTLALADEQTYIRCDNASAITVTVPPQSDVAWTDGAEIIIEQAGAGQVTVAAGAGVTIHTSQTLLSAAQYSVVTLKRVAEDEWVLGGDREAA